MNTHTLLPIEAQNKLKEGALKIRIKWGQIPKTGTETLKERERAMWMMEYEIRESHPDFFIDGGI